MNNKNGHGKGKVKLDATDYSTLELLTKLEKEDEDGKDWIIYWEEILNRHPFKQLDDDLQQALEAILELTELVSKMSHLLKNHEHLHGNVVVKV